MEPINRFPQKGSVWRKWDLHIHSPLSVLNNRYPKLANGEPDWDRFIDRLADSDVAVIAITDYFSIAGYKKIIQYKDAGKLPNIHTILPNIEFRLNSVISSEKDGQNPRRLNFHVIFSDEVSPADIEEHFLHDLHFYYEGTPQTKDESRKLKLSNLEELWRGPHNLDKGKALGEKLISQHSTFAGMDPLEVSAMCGFVSHEEITDILSNDNRFRDKYLIIFPEDLFSLIDWDGQDHHIRKGILQKSDMVFTSSQKTRQWCLGKSPYEEGEKKFLEEFKTIKPCINGSDAHGMDEIAVPCAKRGEVGHQCGESSSKCEMRYCWIKADPTFEGLKQILYEPEERVVIQEEDPTPSRSNFTLSNVKIQESTVNSQLALAGTDLDLNIGLVAVAGGKGTGKTAFVDLLANCFQDRVNTKDENSFVKRIVDQNPDLNVEISLINNTTFKKKISENSYFQEGEILYIAQGELEGYIGEGSDLDQYVNNLIFQNSKIMNSLQKYEYMKAESFLNELDDEIQIKSNLIERLEQETHYEVIQKADIKQKLLQASLKDINQRISDLERKLSADKVKIAKEKHSKIAELKTKNEVLVELKEQIRLAIGFIDEKIVGFYSIIESINKLLVSLQMPEKYPSIIYLDRKNLEAKANQIEEDIKNAIKDIGTIEKEIEQYELGIQDHASLQSKKKDSETSLGKVVQENIEELNQKKVKLIQEIANRKKLFRDLINGVLALKTKHDEVICLFSTQRAKILSDIEFVTEISFDLEKMLSNAEDVIDNKRVLVRNHEGDWIFKKLIGLYELVIKGDRTKVDDLITEVECLNEELKTKIKSFSAVSVGDFYRFIYRNYLSVLPVVKYKNTRVNKLSLGQKATVLIKIYMAEGDQPIIIDSHDEHFDTAHIMEDLIGSIREAKKYRQIILVSNNGNLVINSDAEQIILAERSTDGKISYIAGSIENPKIRDKAVKVLEGGPEAFKKCQQKYRPDFGHYLQRYRASYGIS